MDVDGNYTEQQTAPMRRGNVQFDMCMDRVRSCMGTLIYIARLVQLQRLGSPNSSLGLPGPS
jgi:hypothetical protein